MAPIHYVLMFAVFTDTLCQKNKNSTYLVTMEDGDKYIMSLGPELVQDDHEGYEPKKYLESSHSGRFPSPAVENAITDNSENLAVTKQNRTRKYPLRNRSLTAKTLKSKTVKKDLGSETTETSSKRSTDKNSAVGGKTDGDENDGDKTDVDATDGDEANVDATDGDEANVDKTDGDETGNDYSDGDQSFEEEYGQDYSASEDYDGYKDAQGMKTAEVEEMYSKYRINTSYEAFTPQGMKAELEALKLVEATSKMKGLGNASKENSQDYEDYHFTPITDEISQISHRKNFFGYRADDERGDQCDPVSRYRTMPGHCNNLRNIQLGAAGNSYKRLLPNAYKDDVNEPRGGFRSTLPDPTLLSNKFHKENWQGPPRDKLKPAGVPTQFLSLFMVAFGQFISHELQLTQTTAHACCDKNLRDFEKSLVKESPHLVKCLQADPTADNSAQNVDNFCYAITRSSSIWNIQTANNTVKSTREQFNSLTSFVDLSTIYDQHPERSKALRTLKDGLLKTHGKFPGENLPVREQLRNQPLKPNPPHVLTSGERRALFFPTLASMHIIWTKEHNRIAEELKELLRDILSNKTTEEQDELLFQETRRIVIGELQHVVYSEFLRELLGPQKWETANLDTSVDSNYNGDIDPSISIEFNMAYRFGHSMVPGVLRAIDSSNNVESYALRDKYFSDALDNLVGHDGKLWENEVKGASTIRCQKTDPIIVDDLTEHLKIVSVNMDDIAVRNILRGRDHGIPPYSELRKFCKLEALTTWDKTPIEIPQDTWDKLRNLYSSPQDIDLYVGGLAEIVLDGGAVGPTMGCYIERQFKDIKFGDRYFFTHSPGGNSKGLGPTTQEMIRKRTYFDIICDVTDIDTLPSNIFRIEYGENKGKACENNNKLDLKEIANELKSEIAAEGLARGVPPIKVPESGQGNGNQENIEFEFSTNSEHEGESSSEDGSPSPLSEADISSTPTNGENDHNPYGSEPTTSTESNNPYGAEPTTTTTESNNPYGAEPTTTTTESDNPYGAEPTTTTAESDNPYGAEQTTTTTESDNPYGAEPTTITTESDHPYGAEPTTSSESDNPYGAEPTTTATESDNPYGAEPTTAGSAESTTQGSCSNVTIYVPTAETINPYEQETTTTSPYQDSQESSNGYVQAGVAHATSTKSKSSIQKTMQSFSMDMRTDNLHG